MIGVLVSGEGTNLQALLDAGLPVVAVASNVAGARALERAESARASRRRPSRSTTIPGPRRARRARWPTGSRAAASSWWSAPAYMQLLAAVVPRALPGAGRQRPPGAAPRLPRRAPARGPPRGRRAGRRRHRPLRRRRHRHGRGDRERARPGPRRTTPWSRCAGECTTPSTGCSRRWCGSCARADLASTTRPGSPRSRAALSTSASSSSRAAARRRFLADAGLDRHAGRGAHRFPELLGGRVKTLHPRVHAGILARRERRGGRRGDSPSTASSRSTSSASTSTPSSSRSTGPELDEEGLSR